jgi:hypothetical protein
LGVNYGLKAAKSKSERETNGSNCVPVILLSMTLGKFSGNYGQGVLPLTHTYRPHKTHEITISGAAE